MYRFIPVFFEESHHHYTPNRQEETKKHFCTGFTADSLKILNSFFNLLLRNKKYSKTFRNLLQGTKRPNAAISTRNNCSKPLITNTMKKHSNAAYDTCILPDFFLAFMFLKSAKSGGSRPMKVLNIISSVGDP
jgi:hypothetical protein